jgi:2-polyprenyl-3-methyl-5-hydroxy-6-metoxy-1,4-benzoquinol methylase
VHWDAHLARRTFAAVVVVAVAGIVLRALGVWNWVEALGKGPSGRVGRLIARTYAPLVGFYYSIYARALDLQPEDEVLDVACGSGVFLRKHASHARRIAGLDHSEPMIDEASARTASGWPRDRGVRRR